MLPESRQVDVTVLSRLFANTTNSYKYLLLFAILDSLESRYATLESFPLRIPVRELGVSMLVNAWFPHTYFRLSFGTQDQVAKLLDRLAPEAGDQKFSFDTPGRERLRSHLQHRCTDADLRTVLRYVVQRLLRGFFEAELRGRKDSEIDSALTSLAREGFDDRRPLYRIDTDSHVTLHPDWVAYLTRNLALIRGWGAWEWVCYMQSRNPHVPAVPEKLFPPQERASLGDQIGFWNHAFAGRELVCIYSGKSLGARQAALDHFLPWSFLAHDRLWNLVPVSPSANCSKSDCLPSLDKYLAPFIEMQLEGLLGARPRYKSGEWCRLTEGYVMDLKVASELVWADHLDQVKLREALHIGYRQIVPTLADLAAQLGFSSGWVCKAA